MPGARVGPTAEVGGRLTSMRGRPERPGPARRPTAATPQRPPSSSCAVRTRGSPLARAGREPGGGAARAGAPAAKHGRCRGSAASGPHSGAGPAQRPRPASGPSVARCEGADGGGRAAAEAPRFPPYLAFPDPALSSGLAPGELSQPSAPGPGSRREAPGARLARSWPTPGRRPHPHPGAR